MKKFDLQLILDFTRLSGEKRVSAIIFRGLAYTCDGSSENIIHCTSNFMTCTKRGASTCDSWQIK